MTASAATVTQLLFDWQQGDRSALEKLTPLIYEELRRIAHRYLRHERQGHTLQTTALVNEAYLRLAGREQAEWQTQAHFFAVTARVMRHILIDHARRRRFLKHGGQLQQVSMAEASLMSAERAADLIALDEALDHLKQLDLRKSKVVELRYFGGLSLEETAKALGVSVMTVRRDWRAARAWLFRKMRSTEEPGQSPIENRNSEMS
ncbi:MAG TPA: sigma-70 family RNA polymerase sigma factor [Pyrinomonadaceae bacterium]|nr:sigma-70 family RNA polymerase sigma factor [Pyrinomonadaceae bacterium]